MLTGLAGVKMTNVGATPLTFLQEINEDLYLFRFSKSEFDAPLGAKSYLRQ